MFLLCFDNKDKIKSILQLSVSYTDWYDVLIVLKTLITLQWMDDIIDKYYSFNFVAKVDI